MVLIRGAVLAVPLLLVAVVAFSAPQHAGVAAPEGATETSGFPPSALTVQDKIDWLSVEADAAAQAVDAEAEKPLAQQREDLYRTVLTRGAHLIHLINTLDGRFPRLEARVNEIMNSAAGGLERIANGRLRIGMTTEQVREIRGDPSGISETTIDGEVRQQWRYGATVLVFRNGTLAEIRQTLKGE